MKTATPQHSEAIKSYRDLIAWQRAFDLGMLVYDVSARFPKEERYGLTQQIQRNAISVSSNIAEGYGRGSRVDYMRFLKIARGSLYELDTQLLFATELNYINEQTYDKTKQLLDECERILAGLIRSLET